MVQIQIKGLKEIEAKLAKFPRSLRATQRLFSRAAANEVLKDRGGGKRFYPPPTAANEPPTPYYIRGRGTQHPTYNDFKSQQMNTKFVTETNGWMTRIQNRATYSPHVIGEDQTDVMAYIGWDRLIDVARAGKAAIAERWRKIVHDVLKQSGLDPK